MPYINDRFINDLIDIRNYVVKMAESPTVSNKEAHQAINLLPFIDKKILEHILSDDFKRLIGATDKPLEAAKSALKK